MTNKYHTTPLNDLWRFIKSLFCQHDWRFHRNIYGDEILHTGGRSWWACEKCDRMQVRPQLMERLNEEDMSDR